MKRLMLVVALLFVGCGSEPVVEAPPLAVDIALAPKAVAGDLKLFENQQKTTRNAFKNAGPMSLVDDGRVWEVRREDRLMGTLQISTLRSDVDLAKEDARSLIVREMIPESDSHIRVNGVEVHTVTSGDKTVYVWFGKRLYEVLVLKGLEGAEPEAVLTDVLEHQATVSSWEPLSVPGAVRASR